MEKLLVIVGPTGTGKSTLALKLAKKFNGELVSADSRQVYQGLDIGTGKETKGNIKKEAGKWIVDGVPIHLYDVVRPDEKFSLADYQQLAIEKIADIHSRGKLSILVGGSGLYIQSVTEGLKIPKVAPNQQLRDKLEEKGLDLLLLELEKVDPKTFEKIDKNNPRRVIRALEVYHQTGQSLSTLQEKFKADYEVLKIGLTGPREDLYPKIDKRIEDWFKNGFIKEVSTLVKKYDKNLPSLTSLGYRQVAMYLDGKLSLDEAKLRMKFDHHSYVRRQMTWFKRDKSIYWSNFNLPSLEKDVTSEVKTWLKL